MFAERGYRDAVTAVADLLGWDRAEARRRVSAAEQVCPRTGLDGARCPPGCPRRQEVRRGGGEPAARRRDRPGAGQPGGAAARAELWAGAEAELAAHTDQYTPAELLEWGTRAGRHAGPGRARARRPPAGSGERAAPAAVSAADPAARSRATSTTPRCSTRSPRWWTRTPGPPTPTTDRTRRAAGRGAGRRVRLRARPRRCARLRRTAPTPERAGAAGGPGEPGPGACLDFGGSLSPESLRMLCCDAAVVPIVLDGKGQPLDVGRATRVDPRRAAAGGRGPRRRLRPLRPSGVVVRGPPRGALGAGRRDVAGQLRHGVPRLPPADPPRRVGRAAGRRAAGVLPAAVDRPAAPRPPTTTARARRGPNRRRGSDHMVRPAARSRHEAAGALTRRHRPCCVFLTACTLQATPTTRPGNGARVVPGSMADVRCRRSPWRRPRTASARPRSPRSGSCGSPRTGSWRSARPGRRACAARRSTPAPSSPRSA